MNGQQVFGIGKGRRRKRPADGFEPWLLQPLANVQFKGSGEWIAVTEDPQLELRPPGGHVHPGVYEMRVENSVETLTPLTLKVYFDRGAGHEEAEAIRLPVTSGNRTTTIAVPDRVRNIRIDPTDRAGRFSLQGVAMRRLGSVEFARQLQRRTERWPGALAALVSGQPDKALKMAERWPREAYMTSYEAWLRRYEPAEAAAAPRISAYLGGLPRRPLISVVMPAYNSNIAWLQQAVESVQRQAYPDWELCVADDASTEPGVWEFLSKLPAKDERIKVTRLPVNGGISAATNAALLMATGDWIAFLDHDDVLSYDALALIADAAVRDERARIVYTDEDKIDGTGKRSEPYMKGGWNRELFYCQNYLNHLTAVRRDVIDAAGPLRPTFDGSQDHDLLLRSIEQVQDDAIVHLPFVTYHWRFASHRVNFSMQTGNRSFDNSLKALNEHFRRTRQPAVAERARSGLLYSRAKWQSDEKPLVSLIIPTRNRRELLETAIRSIREKTTYPRYEILIADNDSNEKATLDYFRELERTGAAKIIPAPGAFNFSSINNLMAGHAKGEILGFVNNDIEVRNADWLDEMIGHFARKEVGAVGAKLYYADGRIQHAGVVTGIGGVAGHVYKLLEGDTPGPFSLLMLPRETTAATAACLMVRADLFRKIGGFDATNLAVAFNDIDLCLKIRQTGAKIIWTPFAELTHYESVSRGGDTDQTKKQRFDGEVRHMLAAWSRELLDADPYYSPNLTLQTEDASLALPPRAKRPWM